MRSVVIGGSGAIRTALAVGAYEPTGLVIEEA